MGYRGHTKPLCQRTVCGGWGMQTLNCPAIYNSALDFTSYLSRASRSTGDKRFEPFQVFLQMGAQHFPCSWISRWLGICWDFAKPPYCRHLLLLTFLLRSVCVWGFMANSPSPSPANTVASGTCSVKQLLLIFFSTQLGISLFLAKQLGFRATGKKSCWWAFPGNYWTSDSSLG